MTESTHRANKALALVAAIDADMARSDYLTPESWRIVAVGLPMQPDQFWCELATRAGVKPPSCPAEAGLGVSRETRRVVCDVYRKRAEGVEAARRRADASLGTGGSMSTETAEFQVGAMTDSGFRSDCPPDRTLRRAIATAWILDQDCVGVDIVIVHRGVIVWRAREAS